MAKQKIQASLGVVILLFALSGCSTPLSIREKSTLVGGGIGAASGAIIGAAVGNPGAGAAIGGAVGAGTGALIGDQFLTQERRSARLQGQVNRQGREIRRQRREVQTLKRRQSRSDDEEY